MTTIVAVRKNGYAAIAADTLTTFGNTRLHASQDASHDKILQIGNSYVGVCGSAAHHLVLSSLLAKTPDVQLNSKAAIFETFRKLHPILKEECFLNPKEDEEDPYESSQITALIANSHGIFAIYSMREVFEYTAQREAFLMQQESDMSVEDIAQATGVSCETAKNRLRYAIAKLREGMQEFQ